MKSGIKVFGSYKFPWIIQTYFVLFFVFTLLLIFSVFQSPKTLAGNTTPLADQLFTLASDGMKIVLGALLGSLSMALSRERNKPEDRR